MLKQAFTMYEEGKLKEAKIIYKKVIEIKKESAEAHYNLGITLKDLGELDEAVTSYKKAIELKPNFVLAHNNLGATLKDLGKLDEAAKSYNRAIELKPDFAELYYNLGTTQQMIGLDAQAETSFKKAIELKPNYTDCYYSLGVTLYKIGKLEEAIVVFQKAIDLKPDSSIFYNNLGAIFLNLYKLNDAKVCFKKAIELNSSFPENYNNLGMIEHELGNFNEAETSYKKAILLNTDFAEAYLNIGKNFKALGRIGEAAKNFEIAFKIEPEDHLGANLQLASLGKKKIPKKTPENYLNHFYKNKSKIWNNLESKIYHGKKLIEDAFSQNHNKQNKIEILDLGCGTGSLASFLRPYAKILVAVDLSLAMLNEAEKTRIYDQLYNKDLEQYLSEISNNYDAIVAAAVMIHFYDLDNIFSLIRESLKQNGKFVFSVFEAKKKDRELNSFLMYSHSEKYIASLAKRYKFRINYQQKEIHEYDNEIPVNALIYVLQKSS